MLILEFWQAFKTFILIILNFYRRLRGNIINLSNKSRNLDRVGILGGGAIFWQYELGTKGVVASARKVRTSAELSLLIHFGKYQTLSVSLFKYLWKDFPHSHLKIPICGPFYFKECIRFDQTFKCTKLFFNRTFSVFGFILF